MTELLLGIDIGTSSSKGVVSDSLGNVIASSSVEHELLLPSPGYAEHDPINTWWHDFRVIVDDLVIRPSRKISAIAISGIGPCVLPTDQDGTPLRNAILYGIDTRAREEIKELTEKYGEANVLEKCGSPITTQAVGPKLLWIANNEPEIWQKTKRIFMAHTYLTFKLTGEYILDHHSASQSVPLYDIENFSWFRPWWEDIAPHIEMPELKWPGTIVGSVTKKAASETGLAEGTPVVTGTIDAWAEAVSVGAYNYGDTMLMYGTTMFITVGSKQLHRDTRLWNTVGTFDKSYSVACGMATGGAITGWLKNITGATFDDLFQEASTCPPGSRGLIVLPYFEGERTPIFDPEARGLIVGLTLRHDRGALFRALLEAVAYGVRHNIETLKATGVEINRFVAVGGGARSSLWPQIVSDVGNFSQEIPQQVIGASYGDAFLAALGLGLADNKRPWNKTERIITPNESNTLIYNTLYDEYLKLYTATSSTMHKLASIQQNW